MLPNCRSQFLLDRLGRCLKLFVSTESTFASQFGLDFFIREKHPKTIMNTECPSRSCNCYLNEAATGHCLASVEMGALTSLFLTTTDHRTATTWMAVGGCVCVHECVCDVFAIYNNNIWPRLKMIIIQIIILYFIQIAHTDDFPSKGTQLVLLNVVSHYDLSVLSLSVMGFHQNVWIGGWALFILFFGFWKFLPLQSPLTRLWAVRIIYNNMLLSTGGLWAIHSCKRLPTSTDSDNSQMASLLFGLVSSL